MKPPRSCLLPCDALHVEGPQVNQTSPGPRWPEQPPWVRTLILRQEHKRMKKSEFKANLSKAIREVKGDRETGWSENDSAEVAIKILNDHPRKDGTSGPLPDDKVQQI